MIRIEWFCRRCGKKIDKKEFERFELDQRMTIDSVVDVCEDCLAEYEALTRRQQEERTMFWEKGD